MMKNSEIFDKLNKFYVDLIREGREIDVLKAIQDPDYLKEIWTGLDDSVWIENFWNRLVDVSKSGDKQKFEQLQKDKMNKIPNNLFRFRPLLGNEIRYKHNPLTAISSTKPLLSNFPSDEQLYKQLDDNYRDIMNSLPNTIQIIHRIEEIKGTLYCPHVFYLNDPYDSSALGMKPSECDNNIQQLGKKVFSPELYEHVHNQSFLASFLNIDEPKSLPMWYSYAEQYNGCCLEYDTTDWSEKWKNALFPVNYSDNLLGLKEYLSNDGTTVSLPTSIIPFLTLKLMDWSYEHEWRIVLTPSLLKEHKDKYNFIPHKQCPSPFSTLKKFFIDPSLNQDKLFNKKFNDTDMILIGCKLEEFPRPTKIYFPDIYHNRKHAYSDIEDLLFIAAQKLLIESITELNRTDFKEKPIKLFKMRFTINGIEFDEI